MKCLQDGVKKSGKLSKMKDKIKEQIIELLHKILDLMEQL